MNLGQLAVGQREAVHLVVLHDRQQLFIGEDDPVVPFRRNRKNAAAEGIAPCIFQQAGINPRLIVTLALRRVYGRRARFTERDVEEFLAPSQFPEYSLAMRELLHTYDWTAGKNRRLATIDLPAVGLWGALDHMMPDDGMGVYIPLLPRIVLRVIPGAGHVIAEETPDEVNTALLELLNAHARPGARTEPATSVYYGR